MKASEEVVRRTSLRNCDLYDVVGYRWSGTFSDLKSFLVSFLTEITTLVIGQVFVKLAVKLMLVCVSSRFRTSSLKACGQLKVNCVQLTVHFVYRLVFLLRVRWSVDVGEL